jgi:hypothetical protein
MFDVFKPLEVRHSDTTTIAKNIWKEASTFSQKYLLCSSSSRSIGSLDDELTIEFISIVLID